MAEPESRAPKIRKPESNFPWGFTTVVVALVTAMAIFGSWGFATFGG